MTPALADLAGLWRRVWLKGEGVDDRTTRVLWFQGPEIFVDLRIPADLPDCTGAQALAEFDAAALTELARYDAFAGTTAVTYGVCTWTRAINWQGPQTGADVGALRFTPEGLIETGVHADYAELWTHEDPAPAATRALTDKAGRRSFLVWSDTIFALGRGGAQPASLPLPERLRDALGSADRARLTAIFEMEVCFGAFRGESAVITASTNPCRVGKRVFDRTDLTARHVRITEQSFAGEHSDVTWAEVPLPRSS